MRFLNLSTPAAKNPFPVNLFVRLAKIQTEAPAAVPERQRLRNMAVSWGKDRRPWDSPNPQGPPPDDVFSVVEKTTGGRVVDSPGGNFASPEFAERGGGPGVRGGKIQKS